jgi:protein-tyrosine-phosphatase
MAQALLDGELGPRRPGVAVRSGGFLADGCAADPFAVTALAELGHDLTAHRSRRLRPADVDGADLVVAMTREHVRRLVATRPQAWDRCFTLKELVRRGQAVGPRGDEALADWLARVGDGRRPADLLGAGAIDDVADPIGQPLAAFRATAAELADWCRRAADLLAPT